MRSYTEKTAQDIQLLVDKNQIKTTLARYCRGVDRLDAKLVRSTYWADAWDDHGAFSGNRDDFVDWVIPYLREHFSATVHAVSNHLIELHGDKAYSECYFSGAYHMTIDDQEYTRLSRGRYIDLFKRREDEWRIARRTVVNDWARNEPVNVPVSLRKPGVRGPEDPVYTLRSDYFEAGRAD